MKKLFLLVIMLILGIGGLLWAANQEMLPQSLQDPLQKISKEIEHRLGTTEHEEERPEVAYCQQQGGIIQTMQPEDDVIEICFINDGKDGIRCRLDLYFSKECGHQAAEATNTPDPNEETTLQAFINDDPNSNIDVIVIAPNGEGLTAFTSTENGQSRLESIVLVNADGSTGLIEVDDQARPTRFSFGETVITYSNYSSSSMDITVQHPDGSIEEHPNQVLTTEYANTESWLLPTAHADWFNELACTGEDCVYNTLPDLGTAMGIISCGVGLGSILFSGGATAPMTYLGCTGLATRIVTNHTTVPSCDGDILNCGRDSVFDFFAEHGPKSFRTGLTLEGNLKNEITGSSIAVASLSGTQKRSGKNLRGEASSGQYSIDIPGFGVSVLTFVAEGYRDESITTGLTNAKLSIKTQSSQEVKSYALPYEAYVDQRHDLFLIPDGWVSGEIIDRSSGEPIDNAKVDLLDGSTTVDTFTTDDEGTFNLKPSLFNNEHSFTLSVSHADYQKHRQTLSVSYDLLPQSDQYDIPGWNGIVKLSKDDQEDETSADEEADLPKQAQLYSISFDFNRDGLNYAGDGTLSLNLTPGQTGCSVIMQGAAFGIPQIPLEYQSEIPDGIEIPSIEGTFSGNSTSCSGTITDTGQFFLSGNLNGSISFSVLGQTFDDDDSYPFEVVGTASPSGASGNLIVDGTASIPFN